jgi:hypothetical protein
MSKALLRAGLLLLFSLSAFAFLIGCDEPTCCENAYCAVTCGAGSEAVCFEAPDDGYGPSASCHCKADGEYACEGGSCTIFSDSGFCEITCGEAESPICEEVTMAIMDEPTCICFNAMHLADHVGVCSD